MLRGANERCRAAAATGDIVGFNAAHVLLHETIIDSAHNLLLSAQLKSARVISFPYRHYATRFPGYMLASVEEHAAILVAIEGGDPDLAHRLMREHVNLQGEQLIDVVRMLDLETGGR